MSRELLRKALDYMNEGDWEYPEYMRLMREIEAELAKPDPEPIGYLVDGWLDDDIKVERYFVLNPEDVDCPENLTPLYANPPQSVADLCKEIETELAKPEPDPVAWMTIDRDEHKRCQIVRLNQAVLDEYDLNQYPLYTTSPDQSAQISELITQRTLQESIIKSVYTACRELEEQLAALKVKQEPLSDDEIQDIHYAIILRSTYYEFARMIENAHGIG